MRRHLSAITSLAVLVAGVSASVQAAESKASKAPAAAKASDASAAKSTDGKAAKAANGDSMNLKPAEPIGGRVTEKSEKSETTGTKTESRGKACGEAGKYREVSDFFNIREANSSVEKGEWELEQSGSWETLSDHSDDDVYTWTSLKYGVTEDLFVELEVMPLNLGDGGDQGNGDLLFQVFNRFVKETDVLPSIASWAEMRIPSGDGSSGVDGAFHFNVSKTLLCNFRGHFEGWVETANGHHGAGDGGDATSFAGFFGEREPGRRHLQWGMGPGFDYSFDEKTVAVLNYLMRSSDENGQHNSNILELGLARQLLSRVWLKTAMDIGLDGQEETPNFALKLQLSYSWGGSSCN